MTAVPVIGLVIDAIQMIVSGRIGFLSAMSASPAASRCRMPSLLATSVTTPATSFASMNFLIESLTAVTRFEP